MALMLCLLSREALSAGERRISIGFTAASRSQNKPVGHAWVIISIANDDGTLSVQGYGWYPATRIGDANFPNKLKTVFGGIAGIDGVPGKLNDNDLLLNGDLYIQKDLSEAEFQAVQNVIDQQLQSQPEKTYSGLVNNCVKFDMNLAAAAGLNIPDRNLMNSFPDQYMRSLAKANKQLLIPAAKADDADIDSSVGDAWTDFIKHATDFDTIVRDMRWRAYLPTHVATVRANANAVEQQRAAMWSQANLTNRSTSGRELGNEQSYKSAVQSSIDRSRSYGGIDGTISTGSTPEPTMTIDACTTPSCLFYGPSSSPTWQTQMRLAQDVTPPKSRTARLLDSKPAQEAVLFGFGNESMYYSLSQMKNLFGNKALVDIGPVATGFKRTIRLGFVNATSRPLDLEVSSLGGKTGAQWYDSVNRKGLGTTSNIQTGKEAEILVTFEANNPEIQPIQEVSVFLEGRPILTVVLDYIIVPQQRVSFEVRSGQVLSGLGKKSSDPYQLVSGPPPFLYYYASSKIVVQGGNDRYCSNPGGIHNWANCYIAPIDHELVQATFDIEGTEGGVFGIDNNVYAEGILTVEYQLHQAEMAPVVIMDE